MLAAVLILLSLGLVLVYSSSSAYAARTFGDSEHFVKLQIARAVMGLIALVALARVDGAWLQRRSGWFYLIALALCVLVLVPGIGVFRGGARRWLAVGAVGIQPSELAKLTVVLLLASVLARRESRDEGDRCSLLLPVLVAQVPVAFILMEPDLGTALVIELIVGVMVFTAGLRLRVLMTLGLAALPVF